MDKVGVLTAQNVTVHYELAGLGARVLAFVIDRVILVGYWIMAVWIMDWMGAMGDWIYICIIGFPMLFYFLLCELLMNGQSVGKLAMRIKVSRLDGTQADVWNYLLRWILRPVDTTLGIGLISIIVSRNGQRLGDLAGGTTVITLKQRVTIHDLLAVDVKDEYEPVFEQAMYLSDRQAELIKEVLYRNQGENRWELVDQMAEKVRDHLGLNPNMRNYQFLQTILQDHSHYAKS